MNVLSVVFFALSCIGALYYVMSTLALVRHFRHKCNHNSNSETPMISVLKPVSGVDSEAGANFESSINLDYPNFEVIFGVLDATDHAVPILRKITESHLQTSLFVGSGSDGSNNKVSILCNLITHAKGEIIVITDADTRATPDLLKAIVQPFSDNCVGMVTCLYRGIHAKTIADSLEGLHMTCIFAPGVASANALNGIDFGLGAAIAIRRNVLDEIGGFESIVNYLADDFQIGRKTADAGYKVELSDYVVDIVLSGESWKNILARELRWSRTTRVSRASGHFGLIATFGFAYSLLFLIASNFSIFGWKVMLGVLGLRIISAAIGTSQLGDGKFAQRAYLLPLRDILSFSVWIAGYFSNKVKWRGRILQVKKGGEMMVGK